MENMDNGLTVPKWVLINCPSPKVWDFDEKRLNSEFFFSIEGW